MLFPVESLPPLSRKNFKEAQKLTPYQKKKYVWKMLYIYVLGYEVRKVGYH